MMKTIDFEGLLALIPVGNDARITLQRRYYKQDEIDYFIKSVCWSAFWKFHDLVVANLKQQFHEGRGYFAQNDNQSPNFKAIALILFNQYLDGLISYPKLIEGIGNDKILNEILKTEEELADLNSSWLEFRNFELYCLRCQSHHRASINCETCKTQIGIDWGYCRIDRIESSNGNVSFFADARDPAGRYCAGEILVENGIFGENDAKTKLAHNLITEGWGEINLVQGDFTWQFKRKYIIRMMWVTCEIKLHLIEKHLLKSDFQFVVEIDTNKPLTVKNVIGVSNMFSATKVNRDKSKTGNNILLVYNQLTQTLTNNGWNPTSEGSNWWNSRFQQYIEEDNFYKLFKKTSKPE